MKYTALTTAVALAAALALPYPATAQTMYRCGNTYQDHPCESGPGKAIGSVGAAQSAYRPVAHPECAQRGADALKLTWAREAGQTLDKALAEVDASALQGQQKQDMRKLVGEVYMRRGTAPELRAAVEAGCVAEKEKEAMAGRPAPAQPAPVASAGGANGTNGTNGDIRRDNARANEAGLKKARCDSTRHSLDTVERSQRAGGSAKQMEELRQKRDDLRRELGEAGC